MDLGNTFDAYDDTGWVSGEMNIETCWNGGVIRSICRRRTSTPRCRRNFPLFWSA